LLQVFGSIRRAVSKGFSGSNFVDSWYLRGVVWSKFDNMRTQTHATFEEFRPSRKSKAAAVAAPPDCDSDVLIFARERLGFEAEESQVGFLRSEAKRGIVCCSRQWGKSTLAAVKAIHRAWTRAGSLVLVASPTARQSGEFLAKVAALAGGMKIRLRGDGYNRLSVKFPNGSRIVGLPGKEGNIRGFSRASMLIIDEAARVPDALYKALRPMLAVGDGDLWLLSTPMGRRGFFFEEFEYGGATRWERFRVSAIECAPRIPAAFLEEERASMGALWVRQEYLCEFVDSGGEMFDRQMVEDALTDSVRALQIG
jgi:hypothetical protein